MARFQKGLSPSLFSKITCVCLPTLAETYARHFRKGGWTYALLKTSHSIHLLRNRTRHCFHCLRQFQIPIIKQRVYALGARFEINFPSSQLPTSVYA